jgi:transposase InsO family protein
LELSRSTFYSLPARDERLNQELMRRLDEEFTKHPFYGSRKLTVRLRKAGYTVNRKHIISMDGRGRVDENIFVERLWRSVKYEEVFLHEYRTVPEARVHLDVYFRFYNEERPHEAFVYLTPHEVCFGISAALTSAAEAIV